MKFLHLSDLHIGIRVNEMSMLADQEHILAQIIDIAAVEKPDAVIIAGDIYDKTVPPAEGVALFDRFLTCLVEKGLPVFIISGNHDCAERVAFGNHLMHLAGAHISSAFSGEVENIRLTDGFGAVRIWLLPFIKPATVRRFFPDREIVTYNDAVRAVCDSMSLDDNERNVLVCHQFITGAVTCDSE
ncbi:MAG: exonuclease subunit SbcD, partial [Acutalibacteraceae bacterium]|nr:exonuclease subunit SbcD [Acutalibacteraceae bacterium]